jgi:uncharacterized membrane protein
MSEADESYWLLSETSSIWETRDARLDRHLPLTIGFRWLSAGWRDLWTKPVASLAYGVLVFALSAAFVLLLAWSGHDYILFPALAGFMIVAPFLAIGLYEKSRALERVEPISFRRMIFVRPRAGGHMAFLGLLLCLLMLLWMRAAVLIYALFCGVAPFPGLDHVAAMLIGTPYGWLMLGVGTFVGALFAVFAFAASMFSVPMLLDRRVDALTAMGTSVKLVWNNLLPLLAWGMIPCLLVAIGVATAFVGLIVLFPLLGHATWHAYRSVDLSSEQSA